MDVSGLVGSEEKTMIRLLGDLISKDTTNPPGKESRAAAVVEDFFRSNGIRYRTFERMKGRTNLVGYVGKGKPRLIIATHFDVVPAGDGWKTDPFRMTLKGGKAYGRGATDNKGPMASVLVAGKILKRFERRMKGTVVLACVADEERGSVNGMYYLTEKGKLKGDYAMVPDVGGRPGEKITVAEKGLLRIRITSLGKQAHSSRLHQGINAVWNMVDFLDLLRKHRMRFEEHALLSEPTLNLGTIKGGNAPNTVPSRCEAVLDVRYLPSQGRGKIVKEIRGLLDSAVKKNGSARFGLEVIEHQEPCETGKDNPLARSIAGQTEKLLGRKSRITGFPGTTVVKPLVKAGIKAVGVSVGNHAAHKENEYIELRYLREFAEIACGVALDMLK